MGALNFNLVWPLIYWTKSLDVSSTSYTMVCQPVSGDNPRALASGLSYVHRPLVKSAYQENNFLISRPKHMLWVLKRTVSFRRFF